MEFNTLMAKRALGRAQTKDFSDWAENLLAQGCDAENVAILAGFGLEHSPDSHEIELYFKKCVDELGLVLLEDRVAIFNYVRELAGNINAGIIHPRTGLESLKNFWVATDDDEPLYRIWDELAEDICALGDYDGYYLWNTGLLEENVDEFIVKVARQFLQLCDSNLPEDFFSLCACSDCGHIGKAQLIRTDLPWLPEKLFKLIYRKAPVFKWVCGHCLHPQIKNMFDYEGRKLYLEAQTATQ
jgi:hypothetical protein